MKTLLLYLTLLICNSFVFSVNFSSEQIAKTCIELEREGLEACISQAEIDRQNCFYESRVRDAECKRKEREGFEKCQDIYTNSLLLCDKIENLLEKGFCQQNAQFALEECNSDVRFERIQCSRNQVTSGQICFVALNQKRNNCNKEVREQRQRCNAGDLLGWY